MLNLIALVLSVALFPSSSRTAWMRPESFRLTVGMARTDALKTLKEDGYKISKGEDEQHVIVDYTPTKALTLEFQKGRLKSIRFELYVIVNELPAAFDEEKTYLRNRLGEPKKLKSQSMLIYDSVLPNVIAVSSKDSAKGLGVLVVRYFDPR
jgi:hypothetical protein